MARAWWTAVLCSEACETWLSVCRGTVSGFVVLVTDERRWTDESPMRRGSVRQWLASALRRPWIAVAHLLRSRDSGTSRLEQDRFRPVAATAQGHRTWIALIAVSAHCRGTGVAASLLDQAESRTRLHERRAIQLAVSGDNPAAIRWYAKSGFGLVHRSADGMILSKPLARAA